MDLTLASSRIDLGLVPDVGLDGEDFGAELAQLACDSADVCNVGERNLGARLGDGECCVASDAHGRTRDEGDSPVKFSCHDSPRKTRIGLVEPGGV